MGCAESTDAFDHKAGSHRRHRRDERGRKHVHDRESEGAYFLDGPPKEIIHKGLPFDTIAGKWPVPPILRDREHFVNKCDVSMIQVLLQKDAYFNVKQQLEPGGIATSNWPRPAVEGDYRDDRQDGFYALVPWLIPNNHYRGELKWSTIIQHLSRLREKCFEGQATFKDIQITFNQCHGYSFDLGNLEILIHTGYSEKERSFFMNETLPRMCDLVLNAESVFPNSIPLLRSGTNSSVTISQRQAASLLACAFFCLFPYHSADAKSPFKNYQNPNFVRLFQDGKPKIEKLRCILHYFKRITQKMPNGYITFERRVLESNAYPRWNKSTSTIHDIHITTGDKIEDIDNVLQVDFANEYIGGGVLGRGCVQEEIRFTICPEMIVSLLLCEKMEDNECIFLIGCERYSRYKGYAQSFQFNGNYDDTLPRDVSHRKWCHVVAIDAIYFRKPEQQYNMNAINRELLKAYIGFRPLSGAHEYLYPIATGHWGCGAFNGDKELKAIIQLMAASEHKRTLVYTAYADTRFANSFYALYEHLKNQGITVGDLYVYLRAYCSDQPEASLFHYIQETPITNIRTNN